MRAAAVLCAAVVAATAAHAQSFTEPTTIAYVEWLINGDPDLQGASAACVQALRNYETLLHCWDSGVDTAACFCALDTNALTAACSNDCASGSVFPWMQATYDLRAQCSAPAAPTTAAAVATDASSPTQASSSTTTAQPPQQQQQTETSDAVSSSEGPLFLSSSVVATVTSGQVSLTSTVPNATVTTRNATVAATSTSDAGALYAPFSMTAAVISIIYLQ
ncbi:hypothetical protein HDU83_007247 [Entophlyctis luteolus]|nr:hypothetical protein HDU83_007247 [Entophlyctis luteolus]